MGLLSLCGFLLGFHIADAAEQRVPQPLPEPRSRVVIAQNPAASEAFEPRVSEILSMVNRAMTNLTSKPTPAEAWRSLVSTNDVIGIKVFSGPGPRSGTRPGVAAGLVESLLIAGFQASNIVIWDKYKEDLYRAGFMNFGPRYGIRVEASSGAGYDEKTFYEAPLLGDLEEGDHEYGRKGDNLGRKSYVSNLLVHRITKIINLSPLLNNYRTGVTGNLYSLTMGSVDNTQRFEHGTEQLKEAIPEIYEVLRTLRKPVVLNIVDGLVCQYEGELVSLLHYSSTLNELRFSTDPVALDVLSLLELDRQRKTPSKASSLKRVMEIYENASILDLGVSNPRNIQIERLHW